MLTWKDIIHYTVNGNLIPVTRVEKSNDEWQSVLSPIQFNITRQQGTERPFSSNSCETHRYGKYACVCCGNELFDTSLKFDSGSGWPSFVQPIRNNAIKYLKDESHGMIRVEIQCNHCDAHLGHVFPDGPEPSGLRYCVNSVSLKLQDNE